VSGGLQTAVLAPGFGVQYVVFVAPLLCLVDLPEAIIFGCTAGMFLATVYLMFIVSWVPLQSTLEGWFPFPANAIGMMAWVVLVHFTLKHLRAAWVR
jgi:hypothetical protein